MDYSIEVSFKFKDSTLIDQESELVRDELNNLASIHSGDMRAFDYDHILDMKTGSMEIDCVNYNYKFLSFESANNFILNLPFQYKILWIHKNKSDYVIYSKRSKPDSKKFNSDDKILYKTVLERMQNKSNI